MGYLCVNAETPIQAAAQAFCRMNPGKVQLLNNESSPFGLTLVTDTNPKFLLCPRGWCCRRGWFRSKRKDSFEFVEVINSVGNLWLD